MIIENFVNNFTSFGNFSRGAWQCFEFRVWWCYGWKI